MNAKPLVLLSLAANVALAAALLWSVNRPQPAVEISAPSDASVARQTASPEPAPTETVTNPAIAVLTQKFDWRQVESQDYRKYIANLRAIGCPEETIRDIIVADVNKLFEDRKKSLRSNSTNKFQYWKAGNFMAGLVDPERMEKEQALAKEKRALLVELLGTAPEEKPNLLAAFNPFETMLDFLSGDKQTAIMELMQKYQAKMMKGLGGGQPDAEDMKNIQKSQKEMETELAGILTPDELENYQLRLSQTSMMMRMQLASFEPNEQEFKDIFKYKKAYDDEFGLAGTSPQGKAEKEKAEAAKKEMDAKIKETLGAERYADYERAQDWNFQNIYRVTERNGLPKEDALRVYDMKKLAEQQAQKVRADGTLSQEQRTATLQGIRAETESSMQKVLGEKGYNAYQNQAYWLKTISPDPKTP